ncbi:MAG: hypothetical protein DLM69_09325 [Candidatus Chloroheliales bacterium]|nr:MAG: hypothetical protein DLM69_09325 [Chloroflexota bacterium]
MSTINTTTPASTAQPQGRAWLKIVAVTLPLALLTMLTSPQAPLGGFWGPTSSMVQPNGLQTTLFILLSAVQALAFGLGIAFLIFGYSAVRALNPQRPVLALAAHLAVAWQLINWWPHSNLHATTGMDDLNRLLAIEYGFHITLIISGLIIAYFLLAAFRARISGSRS